jgi:DNA ligase-1
MELKPLFKANSAGSIQQWRIWVEGSTIITEFGQVGGKLQRSEDTIKVGKNVGKKNETSPEQQAQSEAESKWEIQKTKKGYVEDVTRAAANEDDRKGEECMLAHEYGILLDGVFIPGQNHKIRFPAAVQPKLDGHRCRTKEDRTLWSRGQKPITSVPHIVAELESLFSGGAPLLDGELYNHDLREDFEKITSIVKQTKQVHPEHELVKYYIYDYDRSDLTFRERSELIQRLHNSKYLVVVPTLIVNNHEEVLAAFRACLAEGYEGAMIRNLDSPYVGKRSYDLQKLKEFFEAEFPIVGIDEGKGKLQGSVASFRCRTPEGQEFSAKMEGSLSRLREFFENHSLWEGKTLTVRYQKYTRKNRVPRFPVALRFREDI